MTPCVHRGQQTAAIKPCCDKPLAGQFRCSKFGFCTDQNLGFKFLKGPRTGEAMPSCESCPLYQPSNSRKPLPMVSAVCLAYDLNYRIEMLEEAVESFRRQTWPRKELVIVNDTPGLVIECDLPDVRVIDVPPCSTLGEKYNHGVRAARGTFICSWDDDDISLPWRMSLSVEMIGDADYFNPKSCWYWDGSWHHEYLKSYCHNASMYRKTAWEKVGGYQHLPDNSQDSKLDAALQSQCTTVIGTGAIQRTAYLYRWATGHHHGSYGMNPQPCEGTFKLKPNWKEDYVRTIANLRRGIPVWLTNRDSMAVVSMVDRLLYCDDVGPITIVDCESTYQPLLDWYDSCSVRVIRDSNLGPRAPWKHLDSSTDYIVSDADLDLSDVKLDFASELQAVSNRNPHAVKVGLSLEIEDLPDESPLKAKVIAHESQFWKKPRPDGHYDADLDTTMSIYRAGRGWGGYGPAIRLGRPYTARHVPWYLTPATMSEDWRYYFANLNSEGLMWSPQIGKTMIAESPRKTLTVGMATFRDWPGVWATIQGIRLNHPECLDRIEIIVIDNDPKGNPAGGEESHSAKVKNLCDRIGARYEHYTTVAGTAAAKGRIFDLATTQAVMVMDCHVLLPNGVLKRLIDWFDTHPDSKDLYQGPLIGDGGLNDIVGTHFNPGWGSLMYGQWAIDPRANVDEPFEIPMQGCGLFACNKHAWPGFHPLLRGFGPEEFHIHQRFRQRGGKCWCVPWLKWCHRFGNPDGKKPPGLHPEERLRGHLITHFDTGLPAVDEIRKHFVEDSGMTAERFDAVLAATQSEMNPVVSKGVGTALKEILQEFGISEPPGCKCSSWIAKMDQWGIEGCRQHRSEIIGHLSASAKQATWLQMAKIAIGGYLTVESLLDQAERVSLQSRT